MVFKLVRIDAEEPSKIQLTVGTHLFGRGKFLNCDDKRVSRKHGELEVTCDSVVLKALHHNPCFFTKKGSSEKQILKQNYTYTLNNGDQFGLLPDSYWYEVLLCQSLDPDIPEPCSIETNDVIENNTQNRTQNVHNESQESLRFNMDETTEESPLPINQTPQQKAKKSPSPQGQDSPSILPRRQDSFTESAADGTTIPMSPSYTQPEESPERNGSQSILENSEIPALDSDLTNISKRRHSQDYPVDTKKVKTEPDLKQEPPEVKQEPGEVKQEPVQVKQDPDGAQPGPSNQNVPNNNDAGKGAVPPSQAPKPPRERCMYGAQCYRKNPEHKAQFSHPSDSDWGSGERGVCPWGRGCKKHNPGHWKTHDHPPGTVPPQPPNMEMVQRHGNIFYINAHVVNFYDDHYEVEDSDGNSVDYDYEF